MTQGLNAWLLEIKDDRAHVEALTRLLYQLGATGWPELNELAQALLQERSTTLKHLPQLQRTLTYLATRAPKMSAYKSPNTRAREETERLVDQLSPLLTDLELHLSLEAKDELSKLSDALWLGAAKWLLRRVNEVRDQALLHLLADLSSGLGERLLLNPNSFFAEAMGVISTRLKGCGVGHGPLEVVSCQELARGGVFEDLRAVSLLKLRAAGPLRALLQRAEAGERFECALKLSPKLKIDEGHFRLLVKSELLGPVYEALRAHTLKHELSDTTLRALLGDELTAKIGAKGLMKARCIAERIEVLPLSALTPTISLILHNRLKQ